MSNASLNIKGSDKYKEGWLMKRSGGRYKQEKKTFLTYYGKCCRNWKQRWFVLTNQYLIYMLNPEEKDQQDLMFVDKSFEIRKGLEETGYELGIWVSNRNR